MAKPSTIKRKSRPEAAEASGARFRCWVTSPDALKAVKVAVLTGVNGASHSSSEPLCQGPLVLPHMMAKPSTIKRKSRPEAAEASGARFRCWVTSPDALKAVKVAVLTGVNAHRR